MTAPEVMGLLENGWRRRAGVWLAPYSLREEPTPYQLAPYRPEQLSTRPLQPCGTPAAYRRHSRVGEVCELCEAHKRTQKGAKP
jgi:hypothetical protein